MHEQQAAQILVNVLADCYGVKAITAPNVWQKYGIFMQTRWRLTQAELKVAVECIRGRTNIEIGEALGISPETTNKHLDHVYKKAGVNSRSELSALLLEEIGRAT